MLSFRKKILFTDLILVFVFIAFLFIFVERMGFLLLGSFILLFYGIMTWAVLHRLSRPIQQIIDAILPYQQGKEEFLPRIPVSQQVQGDEFSKLAFTLNSLTERIQKQIEHLTHQRKETEGILESLGEGVIALDTGGKITFANQVACKMLEVDHEEMISHSLGQLQTTQGDLAKKCHEAVLQTLQTSETVTQTCSLGEPRQLILDLISAPRVNLSGAILLIQDKTSEYKVVEMGKDFIANASHELRTPITIIRGFAETLDDMPHLSKEMLHEITGKIVRTCGRLDKLVKSLLTLADIENLSEERFRPTDLISLLENCRHILLTAHPDTKLALTSEVEKLYISAESELIDLAIMNILENAVKYSTPPAFIEISIHQTGTHAYLKISDRGIGIPAADLPYVFDRFYTVDKARSRKSGGAGLGLSIVKTAIEKHRGQVSITSEVGGGTSFTIDLPVSHR